MAEKFNHVMLDLETWGVGDYALIVSVGAVAFSFPNCIVRQRDKFQMNVSPDDAEKCGQKIGAGAVQFWLRQSLEAVQGTLVHPNRLKHVLEEFERWLPSNACVWGNGVNFDNRILRQAYELLGMSCPWHYTKERCYRTVRSLLPRVTLKREGVHHNALDDAIFQVRCLKAAMEAQNE